MGCTQLTLARRTCPSRESVIALTPLYYPCHIRTRVLRSPWNYSPSRAQPTNQPASSNPAPARTQAAEQFLDLPPRGISRSLSPTWIQCEREKARTDAGLKYLSVFFFFSQAALWLVGRGAAPNPIIEKCHTCLPFSGNTPKSNREQEELLKFWIKFFSLEY